MKTIRAIIFDMNGVLINDEHLHIESIRLTAKDYGMEVTPELNAKLYMGRTDKEGFRNLMHHFNLNVDFDEFIKKRIETYYKLADHQLMALENALGLLKELKDTYTIALTTSSTKAITDYVLQKLQLEGMFAVIVTADNISKGKPDPEPYLLTAHELSIDPSQCIVIEDTPSGVKSAKAAGMHCIAVATTNPKEKLTEADRVGIGLEDVPRLIQDIVSS